MCSRITESKDDIISIAFKKLPLLCWYKTFDVPLNAKHWRDKNCITAIILSITSHQCFFSDSISISCIWFKVVFVFNITFKFIHGRMFSLWVTLVSCRFSVKDKCCQSEKPFKSDKLLTDLLKILQQKQYTESFEIE